MRRTVIIAALGAALLVPSEASAQIEPPIMPVIDPCIVKEKSEVRSYIKRVYLRTTITRKARKKMRQDIACFSPWTEYLIKFKEKQGQKRWRRNHYWQWQFNILSVYDKTWAKRIGECESGNTASINTGNGFLGAMQWVLSTWRLAGGKVYPTEASLHEHWVRAVWWRNKTSTMQWPACSVSLGYA